MWKRIKFYTVSAIIIALGVTALYYRYQATRGGGAVRRTIDPPVVVQQIQQLKQLVTVKYLLEKAIGFEEEKILFGSEKVLLLVQATVLGGIDFSEFRPQDVAVGGDKSLMIKLPPPQILHVYINEKNTQVWDRTKTWWTPWVPFNPELEQKARLAALEAVQVAAREKGILRDAQDNAESTIRALLGTLGIESIQFKAASATSTPVSPDEAH
jgi:hypothetical protein